jgi:hypothetical protein
MSPRKPNSDGFLASAPAPAPDWMELERLVSSHAGPTEICVEFSKLFRVRQTEVALLRLEGGLLRFLFPSELSTAGAIPLSSSSAIAAHTASGKKVELYNSFLKVKHASVFESVKLSNPEEKTKWEQPPIQRLMSAPVLDTEGDVLGVIQICRKGLDLSSSGSEFTLDDLRRLEHAASSLARASIMQPDCGASAS